MNYIGRGPAPGGVTLVGDTTPVGEIAFYHAPPNGSWLQLNGQVVLKASYPDLWTWAQGFLTADQVLNPGLYRNVDVSNFAVPNLSGLFIRGTGAVDVSHTAAALGVKQADDNLSHLHLIDRYNNPGANAGNIAGGGAPTGAVGAPDVKTSGGTEARPVNVALVPCVKALVTTVVSSATVNALLARIAALEGRQTIVPLVAAAGTSVSFVGLPGGIKKLWVHLLGVGSNGASLFQIQLGEVGAGFATAGYHSNAFGANNGGLNGTAGADFATGLLVTSVNGAGNKFNGQLSLVNAGNNTWVSHGGVASELAPCNTYLNCGSKALPGALDRVRITTVNGVDLFNLGQIGIGYE